MCPSHFWNATNVHRKKMEYLRKNRSQLTVSLPILRSFQLYSLAMGESDKAAVLLPITKSRRRSILFLFCFHTIEFKFLQRFFFQIFININEWNFKMKFWLRQFQAINSICLRKQFYVLKQRQWAVIRCWKRLVFDTRIIVDLKFSLLMRAYYSICSAKTTGGSYSN